MFESFTNECGCQFVRELSSEYGRISYSVSNFCNLHNPLSFGVGARGARPEGTAAAQPANCVRCGQHCLPDGTCHCGATPVVDHTLCDKLFTLGERRALATLIATEHAELLSERRMLVSVRAVRRDDSWEGRIKDIDTKVGMLQALKAKVRS